MKTLLCCIGRLENPYIREFVEHYENIGFTNIVLYDNNRDGEDDFRDVISDYIDNGFVILKDYRNKTVCQMQAYEECYSEYKHYYDWIAFFDCDEFLTFNGFKNISEYLSVPYFDKYNMIHINWLCYGDDNLLEYDSRPLAERFVTPSKNMDENKHIKTIIKGGLCDIKFSNPHTPVNIGYCCNNKGCVCDEFSPFNTPDYTFAYLRHYGTKSTEEYINKIKRGFPDGLPNPNLTNLLIELYFSRCEKTQEKINRFVAAGLIRK